MHILFLGWIANYISKISEKDNDAFVSLCDIDIAPIFNICVYDRLHAPGFRFIFGIYHGQPARSLKSLLKRSSKWEVYLYISISCALTHCFKKVLKFEKNK